MLCFENIDFIEYHVTSIHQNQSTLIFILKKFVEKYCFFLSLFNSSILSNWKFWAIEKKILNNKLRLHACSSIHCCHLPYTNSLKKFQSESLKKIKFFLFQNFEFCFLLHENLVFVIFFNRKN